MCTEFEDEIEQVERALGKNYQYQGVSSRGHVSSTEDLLARVDEAARIMEIHAEDEV